VLRGTLGTFALLATVIGGVLLPAPAGASPRVRLQATFRPDKLGASTTVAVSFQIAGADGELPPPLTQFVLLLPPGLGLATSTLGVATCAVQTLEASGNAACPRDAAMGSGGAVAEAMFGSEVIREAAPISIVMGESTSGRTTILYYFDGRGPIIAPLVFPSQFFATENSPRSELATAIPAISALPGAPDVVIVSLHIEIGADHLTYFRRAGKGRVAYRPVGMSVPEVCPAHGFVFSGKFSFQNGNQVTSTSTVRCPRGD
jgi:hypothetical protein